MISGFSNFKSSSWLNGDGINGSGLGGSGVGDFGGSNSFGLSGSGSVSGERSDNFPFQQQQQSRQLQRMSQQPQQS